MIKDNTLDKKITERLIAKNELKRKNHEPSGKLSASMLGYPLQWQVLKTKGVKAKEIDEYTLRKFLRGDHVEEWVIQYMEAIDTQVFCEYRDCIGYADAIVMMDNWSCKIQDNIPHEVKSVTNMKFAKIVKTGQADPQHILQANLYALALESSHFAIDYVASDDYRLETYIYPVDYAKAEVDRIIDEYNEAIKADRVPVFEPRYAWQKNKLYNNYPEWSELNEQQIKQKLKEIL